MNKFVFWGGVALFVIGLSILVFTGSLPEDIFHFGPWFWITLGGWLMIMVSFAFGPDEE